MALKSWQPKYLLESSKILLYKFLNRFLTRIKQISPIINSANKLVSCRAVAVCKLRTDVSPHYLSERANDLDLAVIVKFPQINRVSSRFFKYRTRCKYVTPKVNFMSYLVDATDILHSHIHYHLWPDLQTDRNLVLSALSSNKPIARITFGNVVGVIDLKDPKTLKFKLCYVLLSIA